MQLRELPANWDPKLPVFPADAKGLATRNSSGKVLNAIALHYPWLISGAADLSPSTKTRLLFEGAGDLEAETVGGRNMHFGIREHAMGAVVNGLSLSKIRPYWFTKEPNVGYETLLYDVIIGDPTLFMRADMVEQTWRIVQPVLDTWAKIRSADLAIYPAGSAGPSDADALFAKDGRRWRGIGGDHDGQSS